ncbi:MAG: hypothetical protein NVS9B12_09250 [Vulcanimicrobiaceae bacterium]
MTQIRRLLTPVAMVAALAFPSLALAQTTPSPAAPPPHGMHHHGFFMREMQSLNLTADQQAKVAALRAQFEQAHPKGSPPDPQAFKAFHEQLLAVLTPAQQTQFKADLKAHREEQGSAEHPDHKNMMDRFEALNLSATQKTQIQSLIDQFQKTHPEGSPHDPNAMQTLHQQIEAILTPAQLQQLREMRHDDPNGIKP